MNREKTQAILFGIFMIVYYALRMAFGKDEVSGLRIGGTILSSAVGAFIFYLLIHHYNNYKNRRKE